MNKYKIAKIGLVSYFSCLAILSYSFYERTPYKENIVASRPIKEQVITSFSKDEYISEIIAKSKYPYTIAAIAKVESGFTPRAVGDNGKSWGMYQIQRHIWKEFKSDSIEHQTEKVEDILESLIEDQGYYEAIKSYNGKGKKARLYRKKVLSYVKQMEETERTLSGNKRRNT